MIGFEIEKLAELIHAARGNHVMGPMVAIRKGTSDPPEAGPVGLETPGVEQRILNPWQEVEEDRNKFISKVPRKPSTEKEAEVKHDLEKEDRDKDFGLAGQKALIFRKAPKAWVRQSLKDSPKLEQNIGVNRQDKEGLEQDQRYCPRNNFFFPKSPANPFLGRGGPLGDRKKTFTSIEGAGRAGEETSPFPRMGCSLSTMPASQGSVESLKSTQDELECVFFSQSPLQPDLFSGHCYPDESRGDTQVGQHLQSI